MKIEKNKDLTDLNTFGIQQFADLYIVLDKKQELQNIDIDPNTLILGGGSNLIIAKKPKKVIKIGFESVELVEETNEYIKLKAEAGGNWDDLVDFCVSHNWWGIENLSAIPGTVGAAPIQNIGAYGVELKDVVQNIEFFDLVERKIKNLDVSQCQFDYRTSIFKTQLRNKAIITSITLKLSKIPKPNLQYSDLKALQERCDIDIKEIRRQIVRIRQQKLPDYKVHGNCGSFFKNVVVEKLKLEDLKREFPEIPFFETNNLFKVPTAWLIEKSGLKGYKVGNVGIYDKHSLIVVNYGGATAKEILEFADFVEKKVFENFGLKIEKEVNVYI